MAGLGLIKIGDNHVFDQPDYPPLYNNLAKDHLGAIKIYEVIKLISK